MVLGVVETALLTSVAFLAYLLIRYPNRAVGTSYRPDLKHAYGGGLPIIGDLLLIARNRVNVLEHQLKAHQENKVPTSITLPVGIRMTTVNRPDWIEYIQKTNFENYVKGDFQHNIFVDMLGNGIFATDGAMWHRQRKASSHIFSANSFRTVIANALDEHIAILLNVLGRAADDHTEVALSETFFRFTLDTFVKMSFGQELGSLEAGKPVPFAEAFDFAQTRLDLRFTEPGWKITERFSATGRRMREAIKVIDRFSYGVIDDRDRQDEKDGGSTDLLALYRGIRDEKGEGMSRKELRDAVLNLILAGRDTTAQALSWTFFYICRNPALLDPIRKEVEEHLPNGKLVDYDNYKVLVQTNALFHEVLRLHPYHSSVPKNGKIALADDVLPNGGPRIQRGEVVGFSDWVMNRDTDVWGPDAAEMKPSRWIDEEGKLRIFSQWQFHAFNGGPRKCLGQSLATYEAVAAMVALARNFDFAFAPNYLATTKMTGEIVSTGPIPTPMYANSVTLPLREPMRVMITRRKESMA